MKPRTPTEAVVARAPDRASYLALSRNRGPLLRLSFARGDAGSGVERTTV